MNPKLAPDWALKRARELAQEYGADSSWYASHHAFAQYIAEREEPPVDPLREEAIKLVLAETITRTDNQVEAIKSGRAGDTKIELAIAALRRGIEIGKSHA